MRFIVLPILFLLLNSQLAIGQVLLKQVADNTGQYIVTFKEPALTGMKANKGVESRRQYMSTLRQRMDAHIDNLKRDLLDTDLQVIRELWIRQAAAIHLAPEYLEKLRGLTYVREVNPDHQYKLQPQSVLPLAGENVTDDIARIDIDQLWNEGYRGQGVVVAILDTGVYLHDALIERWRGGTNSWYDPFGVYDMPKDTLSGIDTHGTGVASVVLGGKQLFPDGSPCNSCDYLGVSPQSTWIAVRILNDQLTTESIISEGLQWVLDPDGDLNTDDYPDIVQNSWGLVNSEGSCSNPFQAELEAIDGLGIDIVFSIGNTSSDPSSHLSPSFDRNVISVGAIDINDVVKSSSGRGPNNCFNDVITPSLVAPGDLVKVASANSTGTEELSGTSFAAPMVSGALALLRSKYSVQDHWGYRQALYDSAIPLPDPNIVPGATSPNGDYGYGLVQASAAAALLDTAYAAPNSSLTLIEQQVNFSQAKLLAAETDSSIMVTVLRSGDISAAASVQVISQNGSAMQGQDYINVDETVSFAAGESLKTVRVELIDDTNSEGTENLNLLLSFPSAGLIVGPNSSTTLRITDDESAVVEDVVGGSSFGFIELLFMSLMMSAGLLRR